MITDVMLEMGIDILDSHTREAGKATEKEIRSALRLLALQALHQQPTAEYVAIEASDQEGCDWYYATAVVLPGDVRVEWDEDYDAEQEAASHLYDSHKSTWEAYVTWTNERGGYGLINVQKALRADQ